MTQSSERAFPSGVTRRRAAAGAGAGLSLVLAGAAGRARAANAATLASKSQAALQRLYASHPKAKELGAKSRAILVFPEIIKAGAVVGGQTGDGAMLEKGRATAFYNTSAASVGLQLGAEAYGYALFFVTQSALDYLKKSKGWSIGTGPSVVVIDEGIAKTLNTTTLGQDVYAIVFNQKGLMAGVGLEGTKITQIHPNP